MIYLTCRTATPAGSCEKDASVIEVDSHGEFAVYCDVHAEHAGGAGITVVHTTGPLHSATASPYRA